MIDSQTYQRLLTAHGRRVANRAAASQIEPDQRDLGMFYAMYGSEARLPENERCKNGVIDQFDPTGWRVHYHNHPCNERSPIYHVTGGSSAYWFEQLAAAREFWGDWVIDFIHTSLVLEESHRAFDRIADDAGELEAEGDEACFCVWFPGWFGWTRWAQCLTAGDILALRLVLTADFKHRHPEPGSAEAEALLEAMEK